MSGTQDETRTTFDTDPARYRHWRLEVDGVLATLILNVAPDGGVAPGYELKKNSYDLGVYIELNDAVQRLRFSYPSVRAVIMTSGIAPPGCCFVYSLTKVRPSVPSSCPMR